VQYQDLRTWSPEHDTFVHRISVANARGHELYILIVEDCDHRTLRARKMAAVEAITDYIDEAWEQGIEAPEPGEVKVEQEAWEKTVARHVQAMTLPVHERPKVWRAGMAT
jgi:hypothetical protein